MKYQDVIVRVPRIEMKKRHDLIPAIRNCYGAILDTVVVRVPISKKKIIKGLLRRNCTIVHSNKQLFTWWNTLKKKGVILSA